MSSRRDFIRRHYGKLSDEEIGRRLGMSKKDVKRLAQKLGLSRRRGFRIDDRWIIVGIFLCALVARVLHLLELRGSVLFDNLLGDALTHDLLARDLGENGFWGTEVFFRAPLYFYLLGAIYRIFGHDYLIPRLFQNVVGAASCVLIFLIGRRIFHRTVALGASLAASLYWIFICFDAELLIPNLIIFLDLLLILSLVYRQSPSGSLFSGILLGLSAVARPNILAFAPLVLLWMAVALPQRDRSQIWTRSALFLAGSALVILPVIIRNYVVGDDLVLIASQGGVNFYIGNNPGADGKSAKQPAIVPRAELRSFQAQHRGNIWSRDNVWLVSTLAAERERGRELKPSEISNFWLIKALRFVANDPGAFFKLLFRKIYFFFNGWEIPSNVDVHYMATYHSKTLRLLSWLRFGLIFPLAVVGMVVGLERWRRYFLLYLFIIGYSLSVILFFVNARYRLPVIPFLLLFGAHGVRWMAIQIRKKSRDLWPYLLLLAVCVLISNSHLADVRSMRSAIPIHNTIGDIYARKGDYERAIVEYHLSLAADPNYAETHNNLGVAYMENEEYEKAMAEYEAALRLDPDYALVHNNRGTLLARLEHYDRAEEEYERAISMDPGLSIAHYQLGMLKWDRGEHNGAMANFLAGIEVNPDDFRIHSSLGMAYAVKGDYEKALYEGREAAKLNPHHSGVHYNLGTILMKSGDNDAAIVEYQRALDLNPSLIGAHYKLGEIYTKKGQYKRALDEYEAAIELDPNLALAYREMGGVYQMMGETGKAVEMLEKALKLDPTNEAARLRLQEVERERVTRE